VKWNLVIVYGAAQLEDKEDFLAELINVCQWSSLSLLIEGEFNLHRFSSEKNKDMRKNRWTDLFNYIINIVWEIFILLGFNAPGQITNKIPPWKN
jgi:hypothetical protein